MSHRLGYKLIFKFDKQYFNEKAKDIKGYLSNTYLAFIQISLTAYEIILWLNVCLVNECRLVLLCHIPFSNNIIS